MEANIFKILGIENKELPTSRFFAWILDPMGSHGCGYQFLNKFCECVGIETVSTTSQVIVKLEEYFKIENKRNFIDIVIKVSENDKKERIIAIENKVLSTEGFYQTKRYYEGVVKNYRECKVDCIYLTKNNSSVRLSNKHFVHKRYKDLIPMFSDYTDAKAHYLIHDFIKLYLSYNYKECESNLLFDNFYGFCEYFVSKTNEITNLVSDFSKSSRSASFLVRVAKKEWFFSLENNIDFLIHYEIYDRGVYLHFETNPYKTMKQLTDEGIGDMFITLRETIRSAVENLIYNGRCIISTDYQSNANLTIAKFRYKEEEITYSHLYSDLIDLISKTENTIEKVIIDLVKIK